MGAGKKKPSGKEPRRSADAAHFVQVRHRVCICALVQQCASMSLVHGPMSTTSTNTAAQYHPLHKSSLLDMFSDQLTSNIWETHTPDMKCTGSLLWVALGRLYTGYCVLTVYWVASHSWVALGRLDASLITHFRPDQLFCFQLQHFLVRTCSC